MKKLLLSCAVALACSSAWSSETGHETAHEAGHDTGHPHATEAHESWEIGVAAGRDYGEHRNLVAVSVAAPIGAGFKSVLEYAKGQSGDVTEIEAGEPVVKHESGTRVVTLKLAKELFSLGHAEFGASLGLAHMSAASMSGNGAVAGLEVSYPLSRQVAAKVEASRFFGIGNFTDTKANVVQAGLSYKF